MIFYYSATGNTRYAAQYLREKLSGQVVNIIGNRPEEINIDGIKENDTIGFMFPIYSWGIPKVMSDFIEKITARVPKNLYIWCVCTCGDEAGTAMKTLNNKIGRMRGRGADAMFSLIMPNTYVLLPGFNVDNKDIEDRKLSQAPEVLDRIAYVIKSRRSEIYEVKEGSFPALRSLVFPLFEKWGVNPRKWKVSSACISCGKCANVCPASNIKMIKEPTHTFPQWGNICYSCCACFHICPVKAISYGKITKNKSQYFYPLQYGK